MLFSVLVGVVAFTALISRGRIQVMDKASLSMYQDRLVPAAELMYINQHLYSKRLLLLEEPRASGLQEALERHNMQIDSLLGAYGKTLMADTEQDRLQACRTHLQAYANWERQLLIQPTAEHSRQGTLHFNAATEDLQHLLRIQTQVGKELLAASHREAVGFVLLYTLQLSVAVIIALLALGLIKNSRLMRHRQQPFLLN